VLKKKKEKNKQARSKAFMESFDANEHCHDVAR
jgi:hypothetical protein